MGQDWFYICPGHLKDRGFCSPAGDDGKPKAEVVGESDAEKEKREKENREKEELRLQVIKEYEEKLARKGKDKKGDKEDKDKDKKDDVDKKEEVKDKKEGPKKVEPKKVEPKKEEEPRVFVLHKYSIPLPPYAATAVSAGWSRLLMMAVTGKSSIAASSSSGNHSLRSGTWSG